MDEKYETLFDKIKTAITQTVTEKKLELHIQVELTVL